MAKISELRAKTATELRTELESLQRALFVLRIDLANQAAAKTSNLGKLKREIAQVKTVLRAQGEAGPAAPATSEAAS